MSPLLSIEKGRSFSIPYDELFLICQEALRSMGLEIARTDDMLGVIEARKPSRWLVKSQEQISLTVRRDSRVVVVAKMDMQKAVSGGSLITENFFDALQKLVADRNRSEHS
jgi:hypothetical protein